MHFCKLLYNSSPLTPTTGMIWCLQHHPVCTKYRIHPVILVKKKKKKTCTKCMTLTSGCSWSGTNSFSVNVTHGPLGSGNRCCSLVADQLNRLLRTRLISEASTKSQLSQVVRFQLSAKTILQIPRYKVGLTKPSHVLNTSGAVSITCIQYPIGDITVWRNTFE